MNIFVCRLKCYLLQQAQPTLSVQVYFTVLLHGTESGWRGLSAVAVVLMQNKLFGFQYERLLEP